VARHRCLPLRDEAKPKLGIDDSLDVFGIHGIGGIVGSVGTAVTMLAVLGGPAGDDYELGAQLWIQIKSVVVAIVWAGVGAAIAFTSPRPSPACASPPKSSAKASISASTGSAPTTTEFRAAPTPGPPSKFLPKEPTWPGRAICQANFLRMCRLWWRIGRRLRLCA
jgi:hypothetical protein